jgi:hypothetical protein
MKNSQFIVDAPSRVLFYFVSWRKDKSVCAKQKRRKLDKVCNFVKLDLSEEYVLIVI